MLRYLHNVFFNPVDAQTQQYENKDMVFHGATPSFL